MSVPELQTQAESKTIDAIISITSKLGLPENDFASNLPGVVFDPGAGTSSYNFLENVCYYNRVRPVDILEESGHFIHLNPYTSESFVLDLLDPFIAPSDHFFAHVIAEAFGFFASRLEVWRKNDYFSEWQKKIKRLSSGGKEQKAFAKMLGKFYSAGEKILSSPDDSAKEMISGLVDNYSGEPFFGDSSEHLYHALGYDLGHRLHQDFDRSNDSAPIKRLLRLSVEECFDFYKEQMRG